MKTLKAWVLVHRKSNQIIEAGGISFNKKEIEPIKIYQGEYVAKSIIVKI